MKSASTFGEKIALMQDNEICKRDCWVDDIEVVRNKLFTKSVSEDFKSNFYKPYLKYIQIAAAFLIILAGAAIFLLPKSDYAQSKASLGDSLAGTWLVVDSADSRQLQFADGSVINLKQGSVGRVLHDSLGYVHFVLEKGTAHINVINSGYTNWIVDTGPYKINVTGTQFLISWDFEQQHFKLEMKEGNVFLTGPMLEGGRNVFQGESLGAWVASGRLEIDSFAQKDIEVSLTQKEIESYDETDMIDDIEEVIDDESIDYAPPVRVKKASNRNIKQAVTEKYSWRELNRQGKHLHVLNEAKSQKYENVFKNQNAEDLLALMDAARLNRNFDLALKTGIAIRNRFHMTRESALATYSIGRIAFDNQKSYGMAVKWLTVFLEEGGKGTLAREAQGRLVEAYHYLNKNSEAQKAAKNYLKSYPEGPHSSFARSILK